MSCIIFIFQNVLFWSFIEKSCEAGIIYDILNTDHKSCQPHTIYKLAIILTIEMHKNCATSHDFCAF